MINLYIHVTLCTIAMQRSFNRTVVIVKYNSQLTFFIFL